MHYKARKGSDFVRQLNASHIVGISSMQMLYSINLVCRGILSTRYGKEEFSETTTETTTPPDMMKSLPYFYINYYAAVSSNNSDSFHSITL